MTVLQLESLLDLLLRQAASLWSTSRMGLLNPSEPEIFQRQRAPQGR